MPNVTRGYRMTGLLTYLTGPGRANEHTEPHLVAGDSVLMTWHDDDELSRDAGLSIARHLDRPRSALHVDVPGGHVWHCSLSLRAEEGERTDAEWSKIAHAFVQEMGFDDGVKAPVRWAAVRHGVSKAGNDHVHLVVNLVREDGTRASTHRDYYRAQKVARELETRFGLEQLESARVERSTRGWDPAEREAQARARARAKYERTRTKVGTGGPVWEHLDSADRHARIASELSTDQPRHVLALKVRGCAAAAESEGEFVRRMRGHGLLVRARYADGRQDVITGYSVAQRPEAGERPIWYGGGHLARDLALPRLRDSWPDTPTGASEAAAEWNAAKRGHRVVAPGREATSPDAETWASQKKALDDLLSDLRSVDVNDRDTWATVAHQTSGALAAWSNATEDRPGAIAAAAEALSRSAQTHRRTVRPQKAGTVALSGAALVLASAVRGGKGTVAEGVMVRQLLRFTQAVYEASVAAGQARQAKLLAEDTRARLVRLRDALPAPPTAKAASATATPAPARTATPALDPEAQAVLDRLHAGQANDATRAVSPVPNKIEPARRRQTTGPGADRGPER